MKKDQSGASKGRATKKSISVRKQKALYKQAEEALQRYELMARHSRDIILFMRRVDGRILEANSAAVSAYGYTHEELLARSIHDLRAPETRALTADQMSEADHQGILFETLHLRKDGSTFPVEVSSQGTTIGGTRTLVSVIRDITERKRAQEALQESETRFRTLADATFEGIAITERGLVVDANERLLQIIGITRAEIIGREVASFVAPEDRNRVMSHIVSGLESHIEQRMFRWDGTPITVETHGRTIEYQGRQMRITAIRDITERKNAEEVQKQSEQAALLLARENAAMAEIGRIISSSLDIEEVYERFAEEVRKLIPFDRIVVNLISAEEGTVAITYVSGVEIEGREKCGVFPIAGAAMEEMVRTRTPILSFWASIEEVGTPGLALAFEAGLRSRLLVPLIARGEVIGGLSLWSKQLTAYDERDVTLAQSVSSQIAGAMVNALLFRERKQAEEMVRTSLEEKEVLLKEIHHRVKNNLQIISSLLYLQASRTEHPGAVSVLRESQNRVRSMALIHERLYASPDLASVDMAQYTRKLVSELRQSYPVEESAVQLRVASEEIALAITEAIPCGLIINELVSNALKHAFPKGRDGEIAVQLRRVGDRQVVVTVSDNGVGFPEQINFRKSPSLGLTLINSLVEQLGGKIELNRSKGTTFTITFG